MSEKLRGLKHFSIPFVILLGGIAVAAYFVVSRQSAHPNAASEKVWPVRVVVAELRDFRPRIRAFGEIRAGREAEIRAMASGRLTRLHPEFRDGAALSAGTELAVIDPVDYEITVAEKRAVLAEYKSELVSECKLLENARRQVEIAGRNLSRAADLASTGRESQRARDDAELAVATAEQTLLQREQTIARLQTRTAQQNAVIQRAHANLDRAARDLSHTTVLAPFDGFVADVRLALGKRVAVG